MIKGKLTYRKPKLFIGKFLRREVQKALGLVGMEWHQKTLPKHFDLGAVGRYRYQKRGEKHQAAKLRKFGHSRPLVFTGALAAQVMRMGRVTATGKGVRIVMKGPKYLYQRRKDYKQPDKAAELTATTQPELRAIAQSLHARLKRSLGVTTPTETFAI